ncbi:MAG: helix-turn-helix transcriptional regulator [Planctomycetota bacterium]
MRREPLITTELAQYPEDTILDERALASTLGASPRTVRRMVARVELPEGFRLGGRTVWLVGTVRKYLEERARNAASRSAEIDASLHRLMRARARKIAGASAIRNGAAEGVESPCPAKPPLERVS